MRIKTFAHLTFSKSQLIINTKMKIKVIRVSEFLFERIHAFCKRENIPYSELFKRAIEKLIEKYLPEEANGQEKDPCDLKDRDDG